MLEALVELLVELLEDSDFAAGLASVLLDELSLELEVDSLGLSAAAALVYESPR